MTQQESPNLYSYFDYRDYLRDYYDWRKNSSKGYSYRSFSKAAGFKSPNFLKLVIEHKRNLTPSSVENFSTALKLNKQQGNYFKHLVAMNQSDTDSEKKKHLNQLKKLLPYNSKRELGSEVVEYLSNWLHPVIREMALLPDFRDDPYWIVRRLTDQSTVKEITQALNFLKKHSFITKREDGTFEVSDKLICSSDEIKSLAVRSYHRTVLGQSQQSLDYLDMTEREFGALILALPEESIKELKHKLKDFREELHKWAIGEAQEGKPCSVVQFNFQMYPQTRNNK